MITFKAIIIPNNRRKDGTYPVKIRVTFKGVSRRLPTTMVCKSQDLTRGNKIKNADILSKSDELINRMRMVVKDISPFDLDCRDVDWVVAKIKDRLSMDDFHLDFFDWCDKFILTKSQSTRGVYVTAVNAFERFLGKRTLDINEITKSMLLDFVEFIDNEPKMWRNPRTGEYVECKTKKTPRAASSRNLMELQHIFKAAKDRYNDEDADKIVIPRSPFDKISKVFPPSNGQKNLGQPLMQKIISYQTDNRNIRIALDIFVVSFGLMGANIADLFNATSVKDVWIYNRQKTRTRRADKAEMRVKIPDVIHPFIQRLQGQNNGWWLSVLHDINNNKDSCATAINRSLKKWCKENDIPEFTFYAARHTWASLARKAGVEKATIDECLAHKGAFDVTDIYAERSWELLQEANKKVLDLFEW